MPFNLILKYIDFINKLENYNSFLVISCCGVKNVRLKNAPGPEGVDQGQGLACLSWRGDARRNRLLR